jgi:hypothetical protein
MQTTGFYPDAASLFDSPLNAGHLNRRRLFSAEDRGLPNNPIGVYKYKLIILHLRQITPFFVVIVYSRNEVTFCGRIMTDFVSCKVPIPPNVS